MYGASLEGLDEDLLESWRSRAVDQPFGTYTRPLRLESPAREAMPKLLIACSFPLEQVRELIAQGHPWFREMAGPEWHLEGLPTGHWPMFSRPDDLAVLLHGLAPDVAAEDRSARGGFANQTSGRTPMSERTAEGAALDLGRLEDFFVRYGGRLSRRLEGHLRLLRCPFHRAIRCGQHSDRDARGDRGRIRRRGGAIPRPGDGGRPAYGRRGGEPHREAGLRRRAVGLPRRGGRSTEQNIYRTCSGWRTRGRESARSSQPPRRVTTGRSVMVPGLQGRGLAVIAFKRLTE